MTALASGTQVRQLPNPAQGSAPMKGSTTIFQGSSVMLDGSGYARPAAAGVAGAFCPGIALPRELDLDRYNNSAGADGDMTVEWEEGVFARANDGTAPILSTTQPGTIVFAKDDQTMSLSSLGGTRPVGGRFHKMIGGVPYIAMSMAIGKEAADLLAMQVGDLPDATDLTIATGAITIYQSAHRVDTEAGAGTDDLDTISGGVAEQVIYLRPVSAARSVVLKHNTGNIFNPYGRDISLDESTDEAVLKYNGSKWVVLGVSLLAPSSGALGSYLASTATGKGASAIGIEDSAGLITATTVEATLAELAKKANAALAIPVCIPVVLSKHSNGSIAARFTPGYAGKIRKITASVTDPVTTGAKLATFTPAIAGVSTTGGALALTSANCTPVGAKVDGSAITAANAFGTADEITVAASAVTAFIEGQVLIYLFLDPAA